MTYLHFSKAKTINGWTASVQILKDRDNPDTLYESLDEILADGGEVKWLDQLCEYLILYINDFGIPQIGITIYTYDGWHSVQEIEIFPDRKEVSIIVRSEG